MSHRAIGLAAVVVGIAMSLAVVGGCRPAAPAGSEPSASRGGAPAPAPPAGAGQVAAADAATRQRVIEAARAEGEVNATISATWTPEGIRAVEDALEREFGVRIKVNYTPVGVYPQRVATLVGELAANTTPSFDLYQTSDNTSAVLLKHDALEAADWRSLLPAGTPPDVVQGDSRLLVVNTDYIGLMYDPTVVAGADAPRSIKDLGNPRWRGKLMVMQLPSAYLPWVIRLGREETLGALRAAMQNGAVADNFANAFSRFAAKEYPLVGINTQFYAIARKQHIPATFTPLDFIYYTNHHVSVPRKAAHPNAARLLAAVLAGPEGRRIQDEYLGNGNRYYESSDDYQLEQEWRAAGFGTFTWPENPEGLEFSLSPAGEEIAREISGILQGASPR